jgi:hypothetical protein
MACQVVSAGAAVVIQNKNKGYYRQGSKEKGPMKSSILIDQEFLIGIEAFRQWSKTKQDKSNCDLAYITLFWRENQFPRFISQIGRF